MRLFTLLMLLIQIQSCSSFGIGLKIPSSRDLGLLSRLGSHQYLKTPLSRLNAIDPSNLPDTLSDGASRAARSCLGVFETGVDVARVDFYTNVFDETYTNLKNTDQFMQEFVTAMWNMRAGEEGEGEGEGDAYRGVQIYYPDAGSAALTDNKWPWIEGGGTVPRVGVGDVMRKPGDNGDCSEIGVFVCMKAQEKEQVELYLDAYRESGKKVRRRRAKGLERLHSFDGRVMVVGLFIF